MTGLRINPVLPWRREWHDDIEPNDRRHLEILVLFTGSHRSALRKAAGGEGFPSSPVGPAGGARVAAVSAACIPCAARLFSLRGCQQRAAGMCPWLPLALQMRQDSRVCVR